MQNPQAVQEEVSSALGIDKKDVPCHVTLLGADSGESRTPDYVVEVALLSKKVASRSRLLGGGRPF